jgi:hypothetical protein
MKESLMKCAIPCPETQGIAVQDKQTVQKELGAPWKEKQKGMRATKSRKARVDIIRLLKEKRR